MHLKRGTVGEGEKGIVRKGGGSVYSQPGIRVDRDLRHDTEEGFQVSKGRVPRNKGRDFQATKGGLSKGLGHAPSCIYRANCVYIVLIKDCV
jgi:hypothetical protein